MADLGKLTPERQAFIFYIDNLAGRAIAAASDEQSRSMYRTKLWNAAITLLRSSHETLLAAAASPCFSRRGRVGWSRTH